MKRILILAGLFFLLSCQKEAAVEPALKFDNVFAITDDPNDPVQQRVYSIYKTYNVPVYFNDTIGKVYIMDDVQGNPIYNVEKIDLGWTFNGYSKQKYQYQYMTDAGQKMKALDVIERYLEEASSALRPFSFFVTQSGKKMDKDKVQEEYKNGTFLIGYRTVYMSGNWTDKQMEELPEVMTRAMVLSKVLNFPVEVADFGAVSKADWYGGKFWNALDPTIPVGWPDAKALHEDWVGAKWYTEEELITMRANARAALGRYGFVRGSSQGLQTPQNPNTELTDYIQEMLKYSPQEFENLWGTSTLVMKKYRILKDVIENKMKVKL